MLFSKSIVDTFRVSPKDFTRNRKQSFSGTVLFMINIISKSLSIEIDNFVSYFNQSCSTQGIQLFTKSAFVQYRMKIDPAVFKYLSSIILNEFYTDNELSVKLWNGFRLLAIDGSKLTLPKTDELKSYFGVTKNQTDNGVVQSSVSVLYDVLNNYALDGIIGPLRIGEKTMAIAHLKKCRKNDLIIFDRGYPGFPLIYELNSKRIDFVMRAKLSFSNLTKSFLDSGLGSEIVEIKSGQRINFLGLPFTKNTTIKVRLVRVELGDGNIEILITSLLNSEEYENSIFKDLYFQRWKVETYYDELKNKLKIEHFSGYSKQSILQDFEAAIFISNVQSLIVGELNDELNLKESKTKYQYKVNTALSYGILRNKIILLFFDQSGQEELVENLKTVFKTHLIPIRPNRKMKRDGDKYRSRVKPKVTKNHKDNF